MLYVVGVCACICMKDEKQIFHFSAFSCYFFSLLPFPAALVFVAFTVVLLFVLRLSKMADCQG